MLAQFESIKIKLEFGGAINREYRVVYNPRSMNPEEELEEVLNEIREISKKQMKKWNPK
jgi:hypothetical protein